MGAVNEKKEYPFRGCMSPSPNSEFCLLVDYRTNKNGGLQKHDYQLAKNSEVMPYLSEIFGEIGDAPLFIKSINESQMAKILSRHHALDGNEVEAAVYLCDIGPGGGITKVHAGTEKFRYPP